MQRNWRSARLRAAALLLTMTCAGCEQARAPQAFRPALPTAPADFGQAVPIPQPRAGVDARLLAKQRGAALEKANDRLKADAEFYRDVQTAFGADGAQK